MIALFFFMTFSSVDHLKIVMNKKKKIYMGIFLFYCFTLFYLLNWDFFFPTSFEFFLGAYKFVCAKELLSGNKVKEQ